MALTMTQPSAADLPEIIELLASWQVEGAPVQVHPGDLGWYERFGAEALAAALRIWAVDNHSVALGFLDESDLIRLAIAPTAGDDLTLAQRLAEDFTTALSELLPPGEGVVEARFGPALRRVLIDRGWTVDDPWTTLRRDLSSPVLPSPLTVKTVTPELVEDRVMVEGAAFPGSSLSTDRWHQMTGGHAYQMAECLVGYDAAGVAVAATTVWSAGRGRPGVIEPLGVHAEHRGRGHGAAMTLAAADAMRRLGCSSATVATPSSNVAAVGAYLSAGFETLGEVTDFCRPRS